MKSAKNFIEKLKTVKVPKVYPMLSLFTNVPLEYAIDLVPKQDNESHGILTSIT